MDRFQGDCGKKVDEVHPGKKESSKYHPDGKAGHVSRGVPGGQKSISRIFIFAYFSKKEEGND